MKVQPFTLKQEFFLKTLETVRRIENKNLTVWHDDSMYQFLCTSFDDLFEACLETYEKIAITDRTKTRTEPKKSYLKKMKTGTERNSLF